MASSTVGLIQQSSNRRFPFSPLSPGLDAWLTPLLATVRTYLDLKRRLTDKKQWVKIGISLRLVAPAPWPADAAHSEPVCRLRNGRRQAFPTSYLCTIQ